MVTLIATLFAAWLIVSVGAGLLVGRGIRVADRNERRRAAASGTLTHV